MENTERKIFEALNQQQEQAVRCLEGPVLIIAGAGSGKTRVLTSRIAYAIHRGVPPERILALTFTRKAAQEMKERIALMVGSRQARRILMGTFHSIFVRFLREYAATLGYPQSFTIYDTPDSQNCLKTIIKAMNLDDKTYKPKEVLSVISMAKNNLVGPRDFAAQWSRNEQAARRRPALPELYSRYLLRCRESGVMDFDDILVNMNVLLKAHPDICAEIAGRFDLLMVDEFQDTNFAQNNIMRMLAARHHNLCVVGDDSQSIYAFRGARIENILRFGKDYPEHRMFRLEQNYRSTKTIVSAANSLIAHNGSRIPKQCFSEGEEGERIALTQTYSEQEEAAAVVSAIIRRMQQEHCAYGDFAVLYRKNSQSRVLEEQLRRRNIPYVIYSGNSFFDRMEVRDLMAYFKLAGNPADDESFRRIVNKPARGIGDLSLEAVAAGSAQRKCPLLVAAGDRAALEQAGLRPAAIARLEAFVRMMQGFSEAAATADAYALAVRIAHESGLLEYYRQDKSVEGESRTANVEELLGSVKEFTDRRRGEYLEDCQADAGDDGEIDVEAALAAMPPVTLGEFIEDISLLSNVDNPEGEEGDDKVALMTAHSSKGLEFPHVFVVGMEENMFPNVSPLGVTDIEEERRLFYVAMTRAEKTLSLSFSKSRFDKGQTAFNKPSRFLREIAPEFLDGTLPPDNPFAQPGLGGDSEGDDGAPRWKRSGGGASSSRWCAGETRDRTGDWKSGGPDRLSQAPPFRRPGTSSGIGSSRPLSPVRPGNTPSSGAARPLGHPSRPAAAPRPASGPSVPFEPSPILDFRAGQRVEHNRFGLGTIQEITRVDADLRARVLFDDYGEKTLLLRYAKMRIV